MLPGNYRAMWFMVSLIIMRLISSILPKRMILVGLVFLPLAYVLKLHNVFIEESDPFQLCTTILCYHFFVFGYYLKKKSWLSFVSKYRSSYNYVIIIGGILLLLLIGYKYVGEVNLVRGNMGENALIMLLVSYGISILSIICLSFVSGKQNKVIELFSVGTLLILCTHQTLIAVFGHFGILGTQRIIIPCVVTLLILLVSLLGIVISNKYFPVLIGKSGKYQVKNESSNLW